MKAKPILVKIKFRDGEEYLLQYIPVLAYMLEDGSYLLVRFENLDVYHGRDLLELAREVYGEEVVSAEVVEE
jgi:hypothetical protein